MKRKLLFTIIFFACIRLFSQTSSANLIKQAEELYNAKRFEESLSVLNAVISQNPNDMLALLDRSCVYDALKEGDKALQDIEIVLKNNKNTLLGLKARHIRGAIYESMGEYLKAIEDENYVLEKAPTFRSALNVRGLAYLKLNLYEEALKDFSVAIASAMIENEYAESYYANRAYAYYYLKRYNDSLSDIDKAIRLDNKDPEPLILKGQIFREIGKYEESIKWASQAIQLAPDYYEIYYLRIADYLQTGQYALAKKDLSFIQPKTSMYSAYHSLMCAYYYLTGDKNNAVKEYKKSTEMRANEKDVFAIKILCDEIDEFVANQKLGEILLK